PACPGTSGGPVRTCHAPPPDADRALPRLAPAEHRRRPRGVGPARPRRGAHWRDPGRAAPPCRSEQGDALMARRRSDRRPRGRVPGVTALARARPHALTTAAEYPRSPGPHTAAVDADVLGRPLGLRLPGIGRPLIGDGTEPGLLDLGPAAGLGLLNGYAATA